MSSSVVSLNSTWRIKFTLSFTHFYYYYYFNAIQSIIHTFTICCCCIRARVLPLVNINFLLSSPHTQFYFITKKNCILQSNSVFSLQFYLPYPAFHAKSTVSVIKAIIQTKLRYISDFFFSGVEKINSTQYIQCAFVFEFTMAKNKNKKKKNRGRRKQHHRLTSIQPNIKWLGRLCVCVCVRIAKSERARAV